ncbi:MAG: ZIP family metal transporter [Candidatus Aenigmatarchaeota archaeon]
MNALLWILGTTFLISLISALGALTLFLKKEALERALTLMVALSAGGLIGGAFLHLMPKAITEAAGIPVLNLFIYLLVGFCLFFILEQFIQWHHHHSTVHDKKPVSYLILISDTLHNFIDGLVIGGSFVISIPTGVVTTLAIALHEIPQEIGDFGVLVYGGFSKKKALIFNYITALTAILGGILGYYISGSIGEASIYLLPFAAGNFIYIASSDLIPEIKHSEDLKKSLIHFLVFLLGIFLMLLIKYL